MTPLTTSNASQIQNTWKFAADVEVPDLVMSSIITGAEIYLQFADLQCQEEELPVLKRILAKWQKELDIER